jgi:hypothetical protein
MANDCDALDDPCNEGTCINGMCQKTPANNGSACDDGKECTVNDSCQAGTCTSGTLKFCPSSDSCHVGFCDANTDACVDVPGNDGAPCQDQDPCTTSGTCSAGTCAPGGLVDCSFLDSVCGQGVCDSNLGCIAMPLAEGAGCDDGLFCTKNDTCSQGICAGVPNLCDGDGSGCFVGACDEAQNKCVTVPGNDGSTCDDGNLCTVGETCAGGVCSGGQPSSPGAMCDDGNACTLGTTCSAGMCGNPTSQVSACIDGDGCCPPGCVVAGDSDCSLTRWSDGTMQWPDQACNPVNSFGGCNTNAQEHADAWATAVCQQNGYSLGVWTGNKQPGCSGDISMWCGGLNIPCQPIYETSCAAGDQTKVELTCFP